MDPNRSLSKSDMLSVYNQIKGDDKKAKIKTLNQQERKILVVMLRALQSGQENIQLTKEDHEIYACLKEKLGPGPLATANKVEHCVLSSVLKGIENLSSRLSSKNIMNEIDHTKDTIKAQKKFIKIINNLENDVTLFLFHDKTETLKAVYEQALYGNRFGPNPVLANVVHDPMWNGNVDEGFIPNCVKFRAKFKEMGLSDEFCLRELNKLLAPEPVSAESKKEKREQAIKDFKLGVDNRIAKLHTKGINIDKIPESDVKKNLNIECNSEDEAKKLLKAVRYVLHPDKHIGNEEVVKTEFQEVAAEYDKLRAILDENKE